MVFAKARSKRVNPRKDYNPLEQSKQLGVEKMVSEDVRKEQEEQKEAMQRENIARPGFGSKRPHKATVDGHTKPCVDCGATNWSSDFSRGEVSCGDCGLVVEENLIDPGAEWTNFSDSTGDRSRVGGPTSYLYSDRGLNTHIAKADVSSSAAARYGMNSTSARKWRRRRIIDERSQARASRVRNVMKANDMIKNHSNLTKNQQEEACRIYSKLSLLGYVAGRSVAGVAGAVCYLVARQDNMPVQIHNVAERFKVEEKELSRMIRQISSKMRLQKVTKPDAFFNKLISDLELPANTIQAINAIWKMVEARQELWQGKKPVGVAAAILYAAVRQTNHKRTQAEICKAADVSEVTIRQILRDIELLIDLE